MAVQMLLTLSRQTSQCGMIPEQVWSAKDVPDHQLYNGHPAGSGMRLAWAHAEYVKLLRSVEEQKVWDTPPQTVERYRVQQKVCPFEIWTEHAPRQWVSTGKQLRMDFDAPGTIVWKADRGAEITLQTEAPRFGLHSTLLALPDAWNLIRISIEQGGTIRHVRISVC